MSIKERLLNVLGAAPRNAFNEIDVKFYKDCLHDVPHGMIVVTNKVQKLNQVAVPFVFPGMGEPPVLTARLMQDIWSAAESQGFVPHYLLPLTYGLHQSEEVEEHLTDGADAARVLAHLDRVLPVAAPDAAKIPAVKRAVAVHPSRIEEERGGLPLPLNQAVDRTTEAQQDLMSELVDQYVTDQQMALFHPPQVDELKSRVLMSISNDQARGLNEYTVKGNVKVVVQQFLQINLPSVALKFPRQAS